MSDIDKEVNEYVDLPDDPEMAFAVLQQRAFEDLTRIWETGEGSSYFDEQRYVDTLIAFDEVHSLGILDGYKNPPNSNNAFSDFFHNFRRHAEISSNKIKMEFARRLKIGAQDFIVLDDTARKAIHILIDAIKEKLNELTLSDNKRESLFNKLNEFAAEVDRDRTRTEAYLSFVVDAYRVLRGVNDKSKPLLQSIDRVLDLIDEAKKWMDLFPPWKDRKKIEGPAKLLDPPQQDFDNGIPF